jgi:hypothetical protein
MRKFNIGLFIVLAIIINTTTLFGAEMRATFIINGQTMSGTIVANSMTINENIVTTQPCEFTFTGSDGTTTSYPCGTTIIISGPKKIFFSAEEGIEVSIDFNSTEGYIFNAKDNYAVGIYELSSGSCVYNFTNNSAVSSVRKIFADNNLTSANERVYVIQYDIGEGVTIRQKFMFVDNQFFKGGE